MIEQYVDAEELKRLLSSMLVVLGCLTLAALFARIVVPGLRTANKPAAPAMVIPVVGETGWLDPTEFPVQRGITIPPIDPKILMTPSPELLARGKALFESNCIQCHGQSGHGDGPAAGTMNPRPRDLSKPDGWTRGFDAPSIFQTLSQGIPGTSMASFDYLPKKDRMALVHQVQSLGTFSHDSGNKEAIEALRKELAAPGEKTSNKIPVSMAMAKLEKEFAAPPPISVPRDDADPEASLLRRAVTDPYRAAQVLAGSDSWRKSPEALAASILADVPGNGFSVNVAELNASDWKRLHAELLKRAKAQ